MPRLPVHTVDDAPEGSRAPLERQSRRVGKTINIFGTMAHAPALIGLYDAAETVLAERSHLDAATREALHLTVAAVNDCAYCQAAYTGAAKREGFSAEQAIEIRRGTVEGKAGLSALLAVAREIADRRGHVEEATWQAALAAGWSSAELLDAYAEVVRTVLTNWLNHLNGTELDLPAAPPLES
ncbi:MAG: carboxymuconolactone decarboxylase family protein [Egibacteraceae bacterium]